MPSNGSDIHSGHRQRLKNRFLTEGLDRFELHNVLELLLFFGIPRKDTNPIAHELIQKFGSFSAAFDAPFDELVKVKGMTENAATLMKLVTAVSRRYELDKRDHTAVLNNTKAMSEFIRPYFLGKIHEEFYVICLDSAYKVLTCRKLFEGNFSTAPVHIRKIIELALSTNAAGVIIAHNHPNDIATPSNQDICITNDIYKALKTCGIRLIDHLIVSVSNYTSLIEDGYFMPGR